MLPIYKLLPEKQNYPQKKKTCIIKQVNEKPSFLSGVHEVFILMGHDAMSWNNWIQFLHDATSYPKRKELSKQNEMRNSMIMSPEHSLCR
jgi:hypothetical protein